jgi:hypothetical protein
VDLSSPAALPVTASSPPDLVVTRTIPRILGDLREIVVKETTPDDLRTFLVIDL